MIIGVYSLFFELFFMINIPKSFKTSRRSVPIKDLEFLYNFIINQNWGLNVNILEFGCGPSTREFLDLSL